MGSNPTTECFQFPALFDRPVLAQFDEPSMTSDAGLLLLKAADRKLGLTARDADRVRAAIEIEAVFECHVQFRQAPIEA